MKHLLKIVSLLLLVIAQGLNGSPKNSMGTKAWVPSPLCNNLLLQSENDVLLFDVYETTHGQLQRIKLGEAKLFFKDEFNVIDFEMEGYFYSAKFEYIIPDKAVKMHVRSNCENFDRQEGEISFLGAGSSLVMKCSGQKFHLIEKKHLEKPLSR